MYYIRTGDSYRQLTAKTLRGAKRQATQAGCNKVYEVCNSKIIDSRTGKVINMLLCVSRKGGMYTYRNGGFIDMAPHIWCDGTDFLTFLPAGSQRP